MCLNILLLLNFFKNSLAFLVHFHLISKYLKYYSPPTESSSCVTGSVHTSLSLYTPYTYIPFCKIYFFQFL